VRGERVAHTELENIKERGNLGDKGLNRKIILNWISRKQV
jgi:hypothetical protein